MFLNNIFQFVFKYLFTDYCLICDNNTTILGLCKPCSKFLMPNNDICAKCGSYLFCSVPKCFKCMPYIDIARSLFQTNLTILKIIHKMKYEKEIALVKFFGNRISLQFESIIKHFDYITYVPISLNNTFWREYNTSQMLAYHISLKLNIQIENFILKVKNNKSQTMCSSSNERKLNVENVFVATNITKLQNKKILIIDDVKTTGATAIEIAKTLKASGAFYVGLITVCSYD